MTEIRDAEGIKHARDMFKSEGLNPEIHNDLKFATRLRSFKAGFDCRDKLDNEEIERLKYVATRDLLKMENQSKIISELEHSLKVAVEALEKIGHDTTVNCQADDAEKECFDVAQVALAKIKEIRGAE